MTAHPEWNKKILLDYDFAIVNLCDPLMFDKGMGKGVNKKLWNIQLKDSLSQFSLPYNI